MLAVNYYQMGYRDDRPNSHFHDIINTGKQRISLAASELYRADNPALAESIMSDIDFTSEVDRKSLNYQRQISGLQQNISSNSPQRTPIEYIHYKCKQQIMQHWEPLTPEEQQLRFLLDIKDSNPEVADDIDFLLAAIAKKGYLNSINQKLLQKQNLMSMNERIEGILTIWFFTQFD